MDNCSCFFFKVPNFDDMIVPSNSGSLGKRSYDAISSPDDSDSLRDQVAELINSLLSSKHISEDMSYTVGQFYDNMIKKGRNMFVKMLLKEHDVTAKLAHMERDMRRYSDCMSIQDIDMAYTTTLLIRKLSFTKSDSLLFTTIKEADIMINELVIANQSMKIDIEKLKEREVTLLSEKDVLFNKVGSLQTVVDLKNQEIEDLVESNLIETKDLVMEVDGVINEVQLAMKENFTSLVCDIESLKSQFIYSTKSIQQWLEKIWSEIVNKYCAMLVLHLCHMSVLLEIVTGMHAENGLLSHGLCESNSVISDLKEHNFRTREELEMCIILKGKLLANIQNSFDCITRKEVEAGEITVKLNTFAKNLSDLQLQEEMMIQRSNEMGSQLTTLMRELDLSNTDFVVSHLDQEKLLKQKVEAIESQAEFVMADWYAKDFELLIHSSEFSNMAYKISDMEEHFVKYSTLVDQLKAETIFFQVETELAEQILMDKEVEVSLLKRKVQQEKEEKQNLLMELKQDKLRITKMGEVSKALEQNVHLLKDTERQAEFLMADWYTKDFELLVCASEFRNMSCNISDMEEHFFKYSTIIEQLKTETIFFQVETELAEQILMDKEVEVFLLKREVQHEKVEKENLLMELKQNILRITEMGEVNNLVFFYRTKLSHWYNTRANCKKKMEGLEQENKELHEEVVTLRTGMERLTTLVETLLAAQNQNQNQAQNQVNLQGMPEGYLPVHEVTRPVTPVMVTGPPIVHTVPFAPEHSYEMFSHTLTAFMEPSPPITTTAHLYNHSHRRVMDVSHTNGRLSSVSHPIQLHLLTRTPYVTGSSVIAIKYKDRILMAAGMGGSYGSTLRYKSVERLKPVGKHSIIGASGEISYFQEIQRYLNELM
ncbi:unnamed protein product [Vicia faba]|uniref:Uncharacterized protein n=1 Tax=Vicia faba TaxID=3906 RepID=A0AAV1BBS3_VICFA|nr:unnamed protein product [Vicia faba]